MAADDLLSFGPYVLDTDGRRLTRDDVEVRIGSRHLDLLHLFASHPGQLLFKDELIKAGWGDVAVTTNSLDQAIHHLRDLLTMPHGEPCIETHTRQGYRFVVDVTRVERRETDEALDAVLS